MSHAISAYSSMDRIKINILSEGNSYQELILKFSGALDVMKPFLLCIQCVSANLVSEIDIFPNACVLSLPQLYTSLRYKLG